MTPLARLRWRSASPSADGGRAVNEDAVAVLSDPTPGTRALPSARCLLAAMVRANQAVHDGQYGEPRRANMRTTLTLLVSDGGHARWAHLSDAR